MRAGARLWRALASPVPYDELLAVAPPAFLRAAVALPPAGLPPQPAALGTLACARARERAIYLRHDLLPKLDVATMAAGVEGRCPFLDPEVLQAPESTTLGPRAVLGKRPLRRGFAAELPPVVRAARKRGFAIPLDRWLREDPFRPDLLRDLRRAPIDRAGVGRMLDLHRRGRARLGHALYLVAALELYLRDQESRSGCASSAS
jgi:asparagine synthase (glutamine-hydrolysing)